MLDRLKARLALAALLLAGSLSAAEPDAGRIARLIAQLGSTSFAEREAATDQLAALGPAALEALRRAADANDPEVRRRAQKLVRQIEQRLTTARLLEPRRVRLVYQDVPVVEAVADLSRKTGLLLQLTGDLTPLADRRVALDTGETTLWEAFGQFLQKAGLWERGLDSEAFYDERYEYSSGQRRIVALDRTTWGAAPRSLNPLVLADGKGRPLPSCQAAAVRIRALPPGAPAVSTAKTEGELLLVLEAMPEPHLRWESVLAVRVERAIDDQGQALKQPTVSGGLGGAAGAAAEEMIVVWDGVGRFPAQPFGDARHVPVRLRLGDGPSKRLRELSGVIAARVQTPPEVLAGVDNPAEAIGQRVAAADGSTLRVVEVKRTEEGLHQVRVGLSSPAPELVSAGVPARVVVLTRIGPAQRTGSVAPESGDFVLLDAKGRRFPLVGGEVAGALGQGVTHDFTLLFQALPDGAKPARLEYTGRRTVTVEVPFTLKDIPLP